MNHPLRYGAWRKCEYYRGHFGVWSAQIGSGSPAIVTLSCDTGVIETVGAAGAVLTWAAAAIGKNAVTNKHMHSSRMARDS